MKILVAEDDPILSETIASGLTAVGYDVEIADDGGAAEAFVRAYSFDLLILDWNMPVKNGLDICRCFRQLGKKDPVLFLTSRSDVLDKLEALETGADDYLTKPFDIRELLARVKALLRRPGNAVTPMVSLGAVQVDFEGRMMYCGDKSARLRGREAELLDFFVKHEDQVVKTEAIIVGVWGSDLEGSELALRTSLTRLRKSFASLGYPDAIENVHGFGYKLIIPGSQKA